MIIEPFKINETTSVVEVAALIAELNALRTERTALRAECEGLREDAERRAQPRVPEGYVLCKAEPVAWVWTVSSLTTISLIKPTGNTTMGAIPMPLYAPAEQAGGEDEPPTKYYGGPRGGSMSQNAPLAAPTEAEVLACAKALHADWFEKGSGPIGLARACLTKFLALRGGK